MPLTSWPEIELIKIFWFHKHWQIDLLPQSSSLLKMLRVFSCTWGCGRLGLTEHKWLFQHIEVEIKWLPLHRWHLQFLDRKCLFIRISWRFFFYENKWFSLVYITVWYWSGAICNDYYMAPHRLTKIWLIIIYPYIYVFLWQTFPTESAYPYAVWHVALLRVLMINTCHITHAAML